MNESNDNKKKKNLKTAKRGSGISYNLMKEKKEKKIPKERIYNEDLICKTCNKEKVMKKWMLKCKNCYFNPTSSFLDEE